jgi:hypothetical protein
MAAAADTLRDAKSRIERMADPLPDRLALSGGLGRVYKNGRKSFRRARRDPSDTNLHEWRKQVKYLLHQIDVARGLGARHLGKSRKLANRLGDVLGIDHDMAVFSDRVRKFGDRGSLRAGTTTIKKWRTRIKKCRSALQKKALSLGRKLYSVRVSQFKTGLKMRKAKSGASRSSRARKLHSVARM